MKTYFEGTFYDGTSSKPHEVVARWYGGSLYVAFHGGPEVHEKQFDRKTVKISSRLGDTTRSITLPGGAKIETDDNEAVDRLQVAFGGGQLRPHLLESSWKFALASVVLLALIGVVGFVWGIPWAAKRTAHALPSEMVYDMGRGTMTALDEMLFKPSEVDEARQSELRAGFAGMANEYPNTPLHLVFRKAGLPNALALPDGTVVVTDELVALAETDEEIFAVLAHEIGHVEHRHALRMALESSAVALFAMAYLGDATQISALAAALPSIYATPHFSREHELEADRFALDYMRRADLDPTAFASILERLTENTGGDQSGALLYLSSHPATSERVVQFRESGAAAPPPATPER